MTPKTEPSPYQRAAVLSCRNRARRDGGQGGFTLVEVMVCTLVLTIGLVAIAALLAVTTTMQIGARESARSMRLAQQKVDELARMDFEDDAAMGLGGALDEDSADHNEADPNGLNGITVRWLVEAGPTEDTRLITVRVVNLRAQQYRATDLTTIIREW